MSFLTETIDVPSGCTRSLDVRPPLALNFFIFMQFLRLAPLLQNRWFAPESKAAETDSLTLFSDRVSEAVQRAEDRLNTILNRFLKSEFIKYNRETRRCWSIEKSVSFTFFYSSIDCCTWIFLKLIKCILTRDCRVNFPFSMYLCFRYKKKYNND